MNASFRQQLAAIRPQLPKAPRARRAAKPAAPAPEVVQAPNNVTHHSCNSVTIRMPRF
jgi:hypothetical protein